LSQVFIRGGSGAVIRPALATQPLLVTLFQGAPPVHISNLRLVGRLQIHGGKLNLDNCRIDEASGSSAPARALIISDGEVLLMRTMLSGHSAGAIEVTGGKLDLLTCYIFDNHATVGGAILVSGETTNVTVSRNSRLENNSAAVSGGAIQVVASLKRTDISNSSKR
jgi:predicted outer membrane repeat protein